LKVQQAASKNALALKKLIVDEEVESTVEQAERLRLKTEARLQRKLQMPSSAEFRN
jgi:hypothetical protein